jgi:hypothetical protein
MEHGKKRMFSHHFSFGIIITIMRRQSDSDKMNTPYGGDGDYVNNAPSNPYPLPVYQANTYNPGASHSALPSFASKRTNSFQPPSQQLQKPVAAASIEYTPRLDFSSLSEESLLKYREMHMGGEMETGDLVNQANAKFQNTPIDERESIAYFIYKCKNSGIYIDAGLITIQNRC